MKCKRCFIIIKQSLWGWGDWYITSERGPYCTEECMQKAKDMEQLFR